MKISRVPTATSRVDELLKACGDFMTAHQLQRHLGLNANRVSAALYHLKAHRAADCVDTPETLWWFATPESDARCRKTSGIVDREVKKNRVKKVARSPETQAKMGRRYKL